MDPIDELERKLNYSPAGVLHITLSNAEVRYLIHEIRQLREQVERNKLILITATQLKDEK